jgi:hypothetical protein
MYTDFVTKEAKDFFNNSEIIRSQAILPFLRTSPYYLLTFTRSQIEIVCVHGGLHNRDNDRDLFNKLLETQVELDKGERDFNKIFDTKYNPFCENAINTRIYNRAGGFCEQLVQLSVKKPFDTPNNLSDFLLTIVGHCPTNSSDSHRSLELIQSDAIYTGCDGRVSKEGEHPVGCVVVDCPHEDGAPRLAFVDTAMSHAFRSEENSPRPVQMLLLTHDPTRKDDKRYFNKIERVARVGTSGLGGLSTILYEAKAKSGAAASGAEASSSTSSSAVVETANAKSTTGGRRPKRKRRTAKKRNLKKRTSRKLTSSRRTRRAIVRRL